MKGKGKLKFIAIGVAIVIIIVVVVLVKKAKRAKLEQEAEEEYQRMLAEKQTQQQQPEPGVDAPVTPIVVDSSTTDTANNIVDELQLELTKEYGECPTGFKWTRAGKMVPTGNSKYTSEEVLYMYFRGLSMQDFSVVQMCSIDSTVVRTYQGYRKDGDRKAYTQFLARQFTSAIRNLQLEEDLDVAVFADGTEYHNVKYTTLDFTDKNFYLEDREKIFKEWAEVYNVERDLEKLTNNLYDYVISKYESPDFPKKAYTVEFKLKVDEGKDGFLIMDDETFCTQLLYEHGTDVISYIQADFEKYFTVNYES